VVLIRRDPRLLVLAAYALLQAAAYLYLRPFSARHWHDYPLLLAFTVFALAGLAEGARSAARMVRLPVAGVALALVVLLFAWRSYGFAMEHPRAFWFGSRDTVYRKIASHLRKHSVPTDVVLTEEVGTIAYYSHLPIFDLIGLVTRDPERIRQDGPNWLAADRVPGLRWLVLYPYRMPRVTGELHAVESGGFEIYVLDLRPVPAAPAAPRP
jgi:hypothetical protein